MLFCRNLLYTAVTRAKRIVVIIRDEETVHRMVDNDRPTLRNSALCERMRDAFHKNIEKMSEKA